MPVMRSIMPPHALCCAVMRDRYSSTEVDAGEGPLDAAAAPPVGVAALSLSLAVAASLHVGLPAMLTAR